MKDNHVLSAALALSVVLLFIVLAFAGCAQLAPVRERIVSGVETYCKQPHYERVLLRTAVNESLAKVGATVKVTCAGDPE